MTLQYVSITQDYRLSADDRQYVLERRHIVDPTRSPSHKPGASTELREVWRDPAYYPLSAAGIVSAVKAVVIRNVHDTTEATTIAELLADYQAETTRLSALIETAMTPELKGAV